MKKNDLGFINCLTSSKSKARTNIKKKQHDGGKKKGKGKVFYSNLERKDPEVPKHQEDNHRKDTLPSKSLVDVHVRQFEVFPSGMLDMKVSKRPFLNMNKIRGMQ